MCRKCEEGIGVNVGYAHYWTLETFLLFPYFQWLLVSTIMTFICDLMFESKDTAWY